MVRVMTDFPREQELRDLLRKHGIGPVMWELPGPKNTLIRRMTCYRWDRAKTTVIVQEYGRPIRRGQAWKDIDGWEIFAPVSNAGEIAAVDADMAVYENCQQDAHRRRERDQTASAITTNANEPA
jgi:hypothetical protein